MSRQGLLEQVVSFIQPAIKFGKIAPLISGALKNTSGVDAKADDEAAEKVLDEAIGLVDKVVEGSLEDILMTVITPLVERVEKAVSEVEAIEEDIFEVKNEYDSRSNMLSRDLADLTDRITSFAGEDFVENGMKVQLPSVIRYAQPGIMRVMISRALLKESSSKIFWAKMKSGWLLQFDSKDMIGFQMVIDFIPRRKQIQVVCIDDDVKTACLPQLINEDEEGWSVNFMRNISVKVDYKRPLYPPPARPLSFNLGYPRVPDWVVKMQQVCMVILRYAVQEAMSDSGSMVDIDMGVLNVNAFTEDEFYSFESRCSEPEIADFAENILLRTEEFKSGIAAGIAEREAKNVPSNISFIQNQIIDDEDGIYMVQWNVLKSGKQRPDGGFDEAEYLEKAFDWDERRAQMNMFSESRFVSNTAQVFEQKGSTTSGNVKVRWAGKVAVGTVSEPDFIFSGGEELKVSPVATVGGFVYVPTSPQMTVYIEGARYANFNGYDWSYIDGEGSIATFEYGANYAPSSSPYTPQSTP